MERKEAIEIIKKNWPDSSFTMLREALETLIPELKESKDERIRISLLKQYKGFKSTDSYDEDITFGDVVAWLEKQAKQKSTWSEEDEQNYDILLKIICSSNKSENLVNKLFGWFKSLKGRIQ